MNVVGVLGRILYAVPFGVFGLLHMFMGPKMTAMVPGWVPGGVFWVYLTGVLMVLICVSLLSNKLVMPSLIVLVAMLGLFILTVHVPMVASPETMQKGMSSLLKDLALGGAALAFMAQSGRTSIQESSLQQQE
jgi:uncharacterized membrane protein